MGGVDTGAMGDAETVPDGGISLQPWTPVASPSRRKSGRMRSSRELGGMQGPAVRSMHPRLFGGGNVCK
jgi:hypothetical protein